MKLQYVDDNRTSQDAVNIKLPVFNTATSISGLANNQLAGVKNRGLYSTDANTVVNRAGIIYNLMNTPLLTFMNVSYEYTRSALEVGELFVYNPHPSLLKSPADFVTYFGRDLSMKPGLYIRTGTGTGLSNCKLISATDRCYMLDRATMLGDSSASGISDFISASTGSIVAAYYNPAFGRLGFKYSTPTLSAGSSSTATFTLNNSWFGEMSLANTAYYSAGRVGGQNIYMTAGYVSTTTFSSRIHNYNGSASGYSEFNVEVTNLG